MRYNSFHLYPGASPLLIVKIDGHGQARILSQEELHLLFSDGLQKARDRALFAVCLYTAARIGEAVTLMNKDVYTGKNTIRTELNIRKGNTKGKLATRTIPVCEDLKSYLREYGRPKGLYLFPAWQNRQSKPHLNRMSASRILREACERVDLEGVSTHSFRRTALTQMSNAGIPLRVIQEISGHRTLDELYKYLEVKPEQVRGAVSTLAMISPLTERVQPIDDSINDTKHRLHDVPSPHASPEV